MQTQITFPGPLLTPEGKLSQAGWSPQPLLDCNLENARFYRLRPLQFLRLKRWDYYAIFTPQRFFSATIADLGYAGNIFVYTLDYASGELHEEGLVVPLSRGVELPRNSTEGQSSYHGKGVDIVFQALPDKRLISVDWPAFHDGRGIQAQLNLKCPPGHESMNIVIPIGERRFYYNRKINCLPVSGTVQYGDVMETLVPDETLGSLDWGRGVWDYSSFWNWASASGFLPDGRTLGLNLGYGFGDLSAASENCLVINGCVHKLGQVRFEYDSVVYMRPWKFEDDASRLELVFTPFKERLARTNLGIINSEVHQMFGRYSGKMILDDGEEVKVQNVLGFAEEHRARW